ncbi:hypothetical protein WEI85_19790 [Actinomycetes bacterium KLBMP 9797]
MRQNPVHTHEATGLIVAAAVVVLALIAIGFGVVAAVVALIGALTRWWPTAFCGTLVAVSVGIVAALAGPAAAALMLYGTLGLLHARR